MDFRRQRVRADDGSRRNNANNVALHQAFGMPGVFNLFSNGDFQSLLQQTIDIPFSAVVGNSAHGDRLILVFLARGQRDVKGFGSQDGVIVKQFVKVSHPKKEQRVAGLGL